MDQEAGAAAPATLKEKQVKNKEKFDFKITTHLIMDLRTNYKCEV